MKFSALLLLTMTFASCSAWSLKTYEYKDQKDPMAHINQTYYKPARSTASALEGGERLFRVNRRSISADGYAIAWGVRDKKIDFEALDLKSEAEITDFENKSKIVNYVVELENNTILAELKNDDELLDYRIAGTRHGNHFSVGTKAITINNLDYDSDAFVVIQNYKWGNEIKNLFIVKRADNGGVSTTLNLGDGKFDKLLSDAILKDLRKKDQAQFFKDGSNTIQKIEPINFTSKKGDNKTIIKATQITIGTEIPKSADGKELIVQAIVDIELVGDTVTLDVLSIESKYTR